MKFIFLLLVFSLNVNAQYRVYEFSNYCGGVSGCTYKTQEKCHSFLQENHKSKPLSDCKNITTELEQVAAQEEAKRLDRVAVRAMVNNINNSDKPAWEKKMLKVLIRNLRK